MLVERHARLDQQVLKCFDQMGVLEVVLRLGHRKEPAFHFVNQGKELFSVWFDYLPKPYNYCLNMASPRLQLLIDRARQHDHFLYLNRTDGQGST